MKHQTILIILAFIWCLLDVSGFVIRQSPNHGLWPQEQRLVGSPSGGFHRVELSFTHPTIIRQRRSVANIQSQGLFGLGGPEIAVILVVAAFIIGPQNLGNMLGQMKGGLDEVPDELKRIPEEFQKGVEEGETNARARKAKKIDVLPDEKD